METKIKALRRLIPIPSVELGMIGRALTVPPMVVTDRPT